MVRRPDQPPENPPEIRVFLVDDHPIVRMGVRDLLEAEPDIKVIGEAGTASSALARIPALKPDVAVLDVRLPDGDGVSCAGEGLTNRRRADAQASAPAAPRRRPRRAAGRH